MTPKTIVANHGEIPPGQSMSYVLHWLKQPRRLAVTIPDRAERCPDLDAEICFDREGWIVIVLSNKGVFPVVITPLEPLRLLVWPQPRGR